ncbi:MAG: ribbon-helix-helix protein, CopG family [Deltaproteobacteria bacterium]|nr:ribbon-helix-helix protein, CopG family [Deltaproteobacteria bacterium]
MAGRQRPTIAITIAPQLLERIDKLASSSQMSRSRFIENLLAAGVDVFEELEGTGLWSASKVMAQIKERLKESLIQRKLF